MVSKTFFMSDEKDIIKFLREGVQSSIRIVDTMTVEENGKIYDIRNKGSGYRYFILNKHGKPKEEVLQDIVNILREVEQNNSVKEFLVHSLSVSQYSNGESKVVLRFTWIKEAKSNVGKAKKTSY